MSGFYSETYIFGSFYNIPKDIKHLYHIRPEPVCINTKTHGGGADMRKFVKCSQTKIQ